MAKIGYLLGYDIGSSSIKATILDPETGKAIASATSPATELKILAPKPGWAEQNPMIWWQHVKNVTTMLKEKSGINLKDVKAIGLSYQMHGLVIVDKNLKVIRPAIIWCDSRAVDIGAKTASEMDTRIINEHLLNSPGNFTASKLKWVKDNEPHHYKKIYKMMLPGDFIAMMMTGQINISISGLSEGILWDYPAEKIAHHVLDYYKIERDIIPEALPTFHNQGTINSNAAAELGLAVDTPLSYRAGDQPNNAFSLKVLNPGEIAATAGTSGVVYAITDTPKYDPQSRVNTFVHVNHQQDNPRYGILLCVNGTGILNSWIKHNIMTLEKSALPSIDYPIDYPKMNELASTVPVGSEGLVILPYGNGAERTLCDRNINASIHGLDFNIHTRAHILRAAQEGIVFALNYGLKIIREMGIEINKVCAGYANMFLSPVFAEAFANIIDAPLELYQTDGSQGAARGAGVGVGIYKNEREAFIGLERIKIIHPKNNLKGGYNEYIEAFNKWESILKRQ